MSFALLEGIVEELGTHEVLISNTNEEEPKLLDVYERPKVN